MRQEFEHTLSKSQTIRWNLPFRLHVDIKGTLSSAVRVPGQIAQANAVVTNCDDDSEGCLTAEYGRPQCLYSLLPLDQRQVQVGIQLDHQPGYAQHAGLCAIGGPAKIAAGI